VSQIYIPRTETEHFIWFSQVGLIIGRGGETIKSLQSRSGVRIQVQNDSETEPGATERIVTLIGNKKATDIAYDMIKEVIDEVYVQEPFVKWLCITFFACLRLCDFLNGVYYGSLPCFFWAIT
jgi:predicted PilT family ATPase